MAKRRQEEDDARNVISLAQLFFSVFFGFYGWVMIVHFTCVTVFEGDAETFFFLSRTTWPGVGGENKKKLCLRDLINQKKNSYPS